MAESKFNETTVSAILQHVSQGMFRESACAAVGITSQTLRMWVRKGVEGKEPQAAFVERLEAAESSAEKALLGIMIKKARKGDWKAAAWILERRYPSRWGAKAALTVKVDENEESNAGVKVFLPELDE